MATAKSVETINRLLQSTIKFVVKRALNIILIKLKIVKTTKPIFILL